MKNFIKLFQPKPSVCGLGRWGSTQVKNKKYSQWFHDMCSQDNCFININLKKYKNHLK
jgi:hypothetical protein